MRYFAAAKAAAGVSSETVNVADFAAAVDLLDASADLADTHRLALFSLLAQRHPTPRTGEPPLSDVLAQSSCLIDGLALVGATAISDGQTVDVLPPFAGG